MHNPPASPLLFAEASQAIYVQCFARRVPTPNSANFFGTNWTDLTDGGSTTLHVHPATGVTNLYALIATRVSMRI